MDYKDEKATNLIDIYINNNNDSNDIIKNRSITRDDN